MKQLDSRQIRAAARRNTAIFAKCWREGVDPAAHQYEMARRIDSPSPYQADFWPRDHGKSEIFCLSYPLRRICEDPNLRILIVQKRATEAEKTLSVIKQELESNHRLKAYYASHWEKTVGYRDISNQSGAIQLSGKKEGAWQQSRIYCKRTRRGKDPTVEAVGVGGAITGGHYDIIILDDIEDDENVRTDERLKGMIEWFTGTIMQLREPHTKIVIVGTLKTNKQDIYNIVLNSPVWDTFRTGAILSHELSDIQIEPVRNEAGVIVDVNVVTPDVKTLWPQKWDIKTLMLEKIASLDVAVWIREKMNDLRALAGKVFKRDLFQWFNEEELAQYRRDNLLEQIVQVWDTAYGEGEENDYSACVTAAIMRGSVYILDVYRAKLELPQLKDAIVSQYNQWLPERVYIENKASGKSVFQVLKQETGVPVSEIDPQGRDKVSRARSSTVYVENQRVYLRSGAFWLDSFLGELTMFPESEHDDQVDAFVYAVLALLLSGMVTFHDIQIGGDNGRSPRASEWLRILQAK